MKKVLIISPYFPPFNTPDSQRIRMSLPYYSQFDWNAEVLTVKNPDMDTPVDHNLINSIPEHTIVHYIKTFTKKLTSKIGLGSIALRSLYFYKKTGDELLKKGDYQLVFFSTTQFPLCILGSYWKKKYNIPYIIDMQDPWHSEYYEDKPKNQRPPKYWLSYKLNKYLEPIAMKSVDGLITVSDKYITDLKLRYPNINNIPSAVITFGYSDVDLQLSKKLSVKAIHSSKIKLSYVGVLGPMMEKSLSLFFDAASKIENFETKYRVSFKGTSYANSAKAVKTAYPIALQKGLSNVDEDTKRLGIYEVLNYLNSSDGLIIFGTDEEGYTSSKLYPYIQSGKPILGIFHDDSNAIGILKDITNAHIIILSEDENTFKLKIHLFLEQINNGSYKINQEKFSYYSALEMTNRQCEIFNIVTGL